MWVCVHKSMGFLMYLWVFKQHECVSVYVNVCVRVSSSCIIQMAWGYSLSCLQENSSREKHAALSVSLCSSSQKQRVKSERDIHQILAFFFLKAIPFDTFSFFLLIIIHYLPALSICNDSSRDFGTEWNEDKWIDNWKYKKITLIISITNDHWSSVDLISDNHLPPKQNNIWSSPVTWGAKQSKKLSYSVPSSFILSKEGKKRVLAYYAHMFSSRNVLIHSISDIFMILNPLLSVRITPARERTTHGPFYWKQVSFRFFYCVCSECSSKKGHSDVKHP